MKRRNSLAANLPQPLGFPLRHSQAGQRAPSIPQRGFPARPEVCLVQEVVISGWKSRGQYVCLMSRITDGEFAKFYDRSGYVYESKGPLLWTDERSGNMSEKTYT